MAVVGEMREQPSDENHDVFAFRFDLEALANILEQLRTHAANVCSAMPANPGGGSPVSPARTHPTSPGAAWVQPLNPEINPSPPKRTLSGPGLNRTAPPGELR